MPVPSGRISNQERTVGKAKMGDSSRRSRGELWAEFLKKFDKKNDFHLITTSFFKKHALAQMTNNFRQLLIPCFLFAMTSCIQKPNKSLLNLVLLNTFQVITPGILISLDPAEGATVSNFSGSITATFRKPLSNVSNQTISNTSDCTKTETKFLLYSTSPGTCIPGSLSVSQDLKTLTFQTTTATILTPATYQIKIQNILDTNSNPVDYQSSNGFTISSSSTTATTTPSVPTLTLSFANKLYQTFQGNAFPTPITATTNGTITNCTISPALPTGLSINATTCAITGTPTAGGAGAQYTVTATFSTGATATASLKIKVVGLIAFRVYGQPNFTSSAVNNGGISATSLNQPLGVVVDANDNVYISDGFNSRILYYSGVSTTATRVYGQFGRLDCNVALNTGPMGTCSGGASNNPDNASRTGGISFDSNGNFFAASILQQRVLGFGNSGSTTATSIFGQSGNLNGNSAGAANTNLFDNPFGIRFDANNNFIIVDINNSRALYYTAGSSTPSFLYGKPLGNYTSTNPNCDSSCPGGGAPNALGLSSPRGASFSGSQLAIADFVNNRVLVYNVGNATATAAIGQTTLNVAAASVCTSQGMDSPHDVVFDVNGYMYVAALTQSRVLVYVPPFTTNMAASFVIGKGSFTNFTNCTSGATSSLTNQTTGVGFDSFGNVYVADYGNNRVVVF